MNKIAALCNIFKKCQNQVHKPKLKNLTRSLILLSLFATSTLSINPSLANPRQEQTIEQIEHYGQPIVNFYNQKAIKHTKKLKVGEVEILEFSEPVSLAHYGISSEALSNIILEKLEPSKNGYKKFIIKAKQAGHSELTFQMKNRLIKIDISIENDYKILENELNKLFGIKNSNKEEKIKVSPASSLGEFSIEEEQLEGAHIYLSGTVASPKQAMLAVAFAANSVGDHGVKIFSNPGGQLRSKDLDLDNKQQNNIPSYSEESFVEYYESTNRLIDTNNLYRDLILASNNEKVISFIKIKEPKRFAVKVRFLEMDGQYVDDFSGLLSVTSAGSSINGALGTAAIQQPVLSAASGLVTPIVTQAFNAQGITDLTSQVTSGNLASGAFKIFDNTRLNLSINDLLSEGVLRIANEFSLIIHSGERVSLGKGIRFPIPTINNNVGGSTIAIEYIPIGFKGELKITALESGLIDAQLASRLSTAEPGVTIIEGFAVPLFKEEFVNSGILLKNGQEVILNAFLTETESLTKSTSPFGRLIPFLGKASSKDRAKNLLLISLKAEEIQSTSSQINKRGDLSMPHLNLEQRKKLYTGFTRKLRSKGITDTIEIKRYNQSALEQESKTENKLLDPFNINQIKFLPGVKHKQKSQTITNKEVQ